MYMFRPALVFLNCHPAQNIYLCSDKDIKTSFYSHIYITSRCTFLFSDIAAMSSSSLCASTASNYQSVQSSDSEPSSPPAGIYSPSDTSAPTITDQPEVCSEPVNVVEVPDIQREETLTCVSPTEKDSTAFLPKASANTTNAANPAPKRPRPSSKNSKKDKKKLGEAKPSKQPPVKKPRPSSNSTRPRPVAKNVLKNLKVGTVGEMSESQSLGDSKVWDLYRK